MRTSLVPEYIESRIASESYANDGKLTVCVLTTENGFEVVGTSAVIDREGFDAEIGRREARRDAVGKLFGFEAYLLQESLWKRNKLEDENKEPVEDDESKEPVEDEEEAEDLGTPILTVGVTKDGKVDVLSINTDDKELLTGAIEGLIEMALGDAISEKHP